MAKLAENKLCPPRASDAERAAILSRFPNLAELIAAVDPIVDATKQNYRAQGRRAFDDALDAGVSVWQLIEARARTNASWYTFKASVQFYLSEEMTKAKADLDAWAREAGRLGAGLSVEVARKAEVARKRLPLLARELAAVPKGLPAVFKARSAEPRERRSTHDQAGLEVLPKRARRSKSSSLKGLPADWREHMSDAMSPELELLWLMQCVTGCRSEELLNGVTVTLRRDGHLHTVVNGAKVRRHAGQPTREMLVLATSGVALKLAEMLKVGVPCVDNLDGMTVNAYRSRIDYYGDAVFPASVPSRRVTAYSARHQFKADIVAAGLPPSAVAMAMGHATTKSSTYYGRGVRSGGGGVTPLRVKATRPVKVRAPVPDAVKARKANKQSTTSPKPRHKPRR